MTTSATLVPQGFSRDLYQQAKGKAVLLAYSGGLDTSFVLAWLQREWKMKVRTVTVDTGGLTGDELAALSARATALGSAGHVVVDARRSVYDRVVRYLIMGNVMRGGIYPLSVAAERVVQAQEVARLAQELGVAAIAHGSTGAGNDQVRFDVAFAVLLPGIPVLTPVRDLGCTREAETRYLKQEGFDVPARTTAYSINEGLWGTTIGGRETRGSWEEPPTWVYPRTASPQAAADEPEEKVIGFEEGQPMALDGDVIEPVDLVRSLNAWGYKHGVGRGIHLGDTILGIKGRVAFEAPAAVVLMRAHRELEKLVLTQLQANQKEHVAEHYGQLVHEGLFFDPVCRDAEALLEASQARVTGDVRVRLFKGNVEVCGCRSPYSLMDTQVAAYGEESHAWTGDEARAFARLRGMQAVLAERAWERGKTLDERRVVRKGRRS